MTIEPTDNGYRAFQFGPVRPVVVEAETRSEAIRECSRIIHEQQASVLMRERPALLRPQA